MPLFLLDSQLTTNEGHLFYLDTWLNGFKGCRMTFVGELRSYVQSTLGEHDNIHITSF